MLFRSFDLDLKSLINYETESYILEENKFSRNRKMGFKDFVYYILRNKGKTSVLEIDDYYWDKFGDDEMPISKQDLSKQRTYLDGRIFKDSNAKTIKNIYSNPKFDLDDFKGYKVFAIDGSQVELPNTDKTRKDFNVALRALKETKTPKARISILSDVKNELIIDSSISEMSIGEEVHAYDHIEKTDKIIDLEKSIIVFDRYYASIELFLQLISKKSNFIFRLRNIDYKKERKRMKTDDEYIEINLNNIRTKNIKNKELKEKAEKIGRLKLRIVNIPLENDEIETLITNIPSETANKEELKQLYGQRWKIEEGYDALKNKIHIENFSGKRRIIIEQDFYAQILMYNMLIALKREYNQKIKEDPKYKNCKCEYKVNINLLSGQLKNYLITMVFTKNKKEQEKIDKRMYKKATRYLIKVPTQKENKRNTKNQPKKYPYNNRKNF
ncbi:IS4 family transposase [Methanobrevibacter sp. DSM 116169]|uniref:IS4 family transposase n=1 Tax=Methanobrevibacter sp. DSM 116169 TaxID=3242727 RepID=UPI0038FBF5C0